MVLNLIHVYQYHTPFKNSPKNSTHNLSFELYLQFLQTLWQVLFCHKYIPYIQFFIFCWIFKIIDYVKFQINQIYLKQTKRIQNVMSIHYQKK
jgi:hypothetical protein